MGRSGGRALAIVVGGIVGVMLACSTADHAIGPGGSFDAIVVSPESSSVHVGSSTSLSAVARTASGDSITMAFYWSSSDTSVATVDQSGVVSGKTVGTAQIAASTQGLSGVATINVVAQTIGAIVVVPSSATLRVNTTLQLVDTIKSATGAALSGQVVSWGSDNTSVATVDASGLVVARATGTAQITATAGGISGVSTITVGQPPIASIVVTPHDPSVMVGQTVQLTATAEDSNGNPIIGSSITWKSLTHSIATVNSTGLVTGVSPGRVAIHGDAGGVIGYDTVVVTAPPVGSVVLTPATSSIVIGQTEQLSAQVNSPSGQPITGSAVTFVSGNNAIAAVNPSSGVVTGVGVGNTTITGSSQGVVGQASVSVSPVPIASVSVHPADTTIPSDGQAQLHAVVIDSLGHTVSSPTLSWSSTPGGRVSQSGLVTPQPSDVGNAIAVVATSGGRSGFATVNVTTPPPPQVGTVTVEPADTTIAPTQTAQMRVTVTDVTGHVIPSPTVVWSSVPAGLISSSGLVTPGATDAGLTIGVIATSGGVTGLAAVNVSVPTPGPPATISAARAQH